MRILLLTLFFATTALAEAKLTLKKSTFCPDAWDKDCPTGKYSETRTTRLLAVDKKGDPLKEIPSIECSSRIAVMMKTEELEKLPAICSPYFLSDGGFFVADCFEHDAVCNDCYVRLYTKGGKPDAKFEFAFPKSHKEAMTPKDRIVAIDKIEIVKDQLFIDGTFSGKIVGSKKLSDPECIGDGCDYEFLKGKITFSRNGKILIKEIKK